MTSALPIDGRVPLAHWQAIRARGADAASFLQSQLTNDVASMDERSVRLAGFCSAKGRLQASFIVWRPAPDEFVLACAASVAAATLKRLSMFVLRAQCKLQDAAGDLRLDGAAGPAAQALVGDLAPWQRRAGSPDILRLPDVDGIRRCLVAESPVPPVEQDAGGPPRLDLAAWRRLEVRSAIPLIESSTADRFVPQMINFEVIGGVDFQKGCYPGQEVVARSQYRGTIKRRMFVFESDACAEPGAEVYDRADPGQPAGQIVNVAPAAGTGGSVVLAEVKLAALEGARLHLGSADGPALRGGTLPYALPVNA